MFTLKFYALGDIFTDEVDFISVYDDSEYLLEYPFTTDFYTTVEE